MMTERLTPEREQEIRQAIKPSSTGLTPPYVAELLAELDAVRAELEAVRAEYGEQSAHYAHAASKVERPEWSDEALKELTERIDEFEAVRTKGMVEARTAYLHGH